MISEVTNPDRIDYYSWVPASPDADLTGCVVFDIETNGLLDVLDTVHCIVVKDLGTGERISGHHDSLPLALKALEEARVIIGHNIINFDIPALQKVYPDWKPKGHAYDTINATRLIWPELKLDDFTAHRAATKKNQKPALPPKLIGAHSLEAWGYRLGKLKGDFGKTTDWSCWTPSMQSYCEQDVEVTEALFCFILSKDYSQEALALEFAFQKPIAAQERHGLPFNLKEAEALYGELAAKRTDLILRLREIFPDKVVRTKFTPKVNNSRYGYVKGQEMEKVTTITFNPASNQHITDRLRDKYQWVPEVFTEGGEPQIDEDVLTALPYPEAKLLLEFRELNKIISMLSEGQTGWLKLVKPPQDGSGLGRIHGRVTTNGTVSGRCAHSKPNLGQVPKQGDLGQRCRELFCALPGWVMVGADASGLELRVFGHFLARYDGGRYAQEVVKGDVHTANQKAAGLASRDDAKTMIYQFLYGAGPILLGVFHAPNGTLEQKRKAGLALKRRFLARTPAIKKLIDALGATLDQRRWLKGMDGRKLRVRSKHSVLNLLFQSAGALLVKLATVLWHEMLKEKGLIHGKDYIQVVHVHDEVQALARPEHAELVGQTFAQAIERAGKHFAFRVPMTGEYKIGNNWKETH